MAATNSGDEGRKVKVVVATTVMLSFISFWRAAAIVLNDLGSSAFYVGGIAEQAIGRSAPWFILAVMLLSYGVRAIYIESSSMFTRGGVYRVVRESMGGAMAKVSVSALMFDYILTGPISGVSAGLYLAGLINDVSARQGWGIRLPSNFTAMLFAAAITVYFWQRNIRGIPKSSEDALRIMYVATVMVLIVIVWGFVTIFHTGGRLAPIPRLANLSFAENALGWLRSWRWFEPRGTRYNIVDSAPRIVGVVGILIALGQSVLAMSGEETLAQVNRELENPKLKNLKRTGLVIFIYSLLFTSLVSFLAVAIIPDAVRHRYLDNLISGLAMSFVGPTILKLSFQAFVVIVGFLMLAGAVNTAIVGSNGVLNRVSEDGVLAAWFRTPHRRFGTTHRIIDLIVILQLVTIVISRGNILILGEAYAFGVIWSFTFIALGTLILRFKKRDGREWKVPGNLEIGGIEIPLGIAFITGVLLAIALTNLFTKEAATISGLSCTAIFFAIFTISERMNSKRYGETPMLDEFNLTPEPELSMATVEVRPGNVLVALRDHKRLDCLARLLERTDPSKQDIVAVTVRMVSRDEQGGELQDAATLTELEQRLFSEIVRLAEKQGKPVRLIVVPSVNLFDALVQTAQRLSAADIVVGQSASMKIRQQAHWFIRAWKRSRVKPLIYPRLTIIGSNGATHSFDLRD